MYIHAYIHTYIERVEIIAVTYIYRVTHTHTHTHTYIYIACGDSGSGGVDRHQNLCPGSFRYATLLLYFTTQTSKPLSGQFQVCHFG